MTGKVITQPSHRGKNAKAELWRSRSNFGKDLGKMGSENDKNASTGTGS